LSVFFDGERINKRAEGQRTRGKILGEAIRLFARHGYAGTSVQMIAEASGIGKSAVFWHYATKDKLLEAVLDKIIGDFITQVAESARKNKSLDEESLIRFAIRTDRSLTMRDLSGSRAVFALMIESANFDNPAAPVFRNRWKLYRDFLSSAVAAGQRKGVFRKDVDSKWAGILMVGLLNGVFSQWFVDPESVDLEESYVVIERMALDFLVDKREE